MFTQEAIFHHQRGKSLQRARDRIEAEKRRNWAVNEPGPATGINVPNASIFAQNDVYLELTNPGWSSQWRMVFGLSWVILCIPILVWVTYGITLHPLLFNAYLLGLKRVEYVPESAVLLWIGWLLIMPLTLVACLLAYVSLRRRGAGSAFFTYARGRVRFNRVTRKVYVLRPGYAGGSRIFDWDRLVALIADTRSIRNKPLADRYLVLYHRARAEEPTDQEDAIYVGDDLLDEEGVAALWEYIRLFMEEGPSVDAIPPKAPASYRKIPRDLPPVYTTYCGMPDRDQYKLERRPGMMETTYHMISQMTCTWPRFPAAWHSDSGVGEPEDRPVQAGAVMTAMVYRAKGKLSKADEVEFLRRWGTKEALAEAMAA
ncbi:DUF6708 domain-containing protein [Cupriavidus pauculus]|uniref:DUF6708 domain-containing protein n=1 Tax=Cupriavidus pauculus TaxID=82633 RepID=UPI001FD48992|nr:DUF6708 domain-containing protein [Cupriavidus pauculus]